MRYLHETAIELAERLRGDDAARAGLDTVLFVNSGSEANDVAWRLATTFTGQRGAPVTAFAYHGVTEATAALSPESWQARRRPGPRRDLGAAGPAARHDLDGGRFDAAIGRLGDAWLRARPRRSSTAC